MSSDKLNAAFQLLNNCNNEMATAFQHLAAAIDYQRQAFELLQVKSVLESITTVAPALPTTPSPVAPAGNLPEVRFALWVNGERVSGSIEVKDGELTANYRCLFFKSDPSPDGKLLNGYILPKDSTSQGSLKDNKLGGAWIYKGTDATSFRVSGYIDSTSVNNKVSFDGTINTVEVRSSDRAPHLKGTVTANNKFFTQSTEQMLTTPQPVADTNPLAQVAGDNVLSGLMSAPGAPADPVLPQATPPTNPDMLVESTVDDIRDLLG